MLVCKGMFETAPPALEHSPIHLSALSFFYGSTALVGSTLSKFRNHTQTNHTR